MGETRQLAEFAVKFRLDECPLPVTAQAKRCIIETLGCALAGAKTSLAQAAVRSVKRQGEGGCATVIGLGFRAAPDRAAFVNGISANALDYDGGIMRQGHYGPTAVPSALAAGEMVSASGRQLLEAVIVAYEIVSRIGRAIRASEPQSRLVSGYGPHQGFASVAAVGRLLSLTVDQMVHAFGIYGAFAPVPSAKQWNWNNRPLSWTKDMVAWPSMAGISAALLAESGFLGPRAIFEGENGFFRMAGSDQYAPEILVAGLGEQFNILRVYFKPYPCCRWNHAALDGVGQILQRRGWGEAEVKSVEVGVAGEVLSDLNDHAPHNLVDAEFSMPFAVALLLLGMTPGPRWHDPALIDSPRVRETMRKVTLRLDADMERLFTDKRTAGAVVRVQGVDETVEVVRVDSPRGSEDLPMTDTELVAKFRVLAAESTKERSAGRIIQLLNDLEHVQDISELGQLLIGDLPGVAAHC